MVKTFTLTRLWNLSDHLIFCTAAIYKSQLGVCERPLLLTCCPPLAYCARSPWTKQHGVPNLKGLCDLQSDHGPQYSPNVSELNNAHRARDAVKVNSGEVKPVRSCTIYSRRSCYTFSQTRNATYYDRTRTCPPPTKDLHKDT
jgi:hypothetical protein